MVLEASQESVHHHKRIQNFHSEPELSQTFVHSDLPRFYNSTNRSFQLYEDEAPARQQYDAVGHPNYAEGLELEGYPAEGFDALSECVLNLGFEQEDRAQLQPYRGVPLQLWLSRHSSC